MAARRSELKKAEGGEDAEGVRKAAVAAVWRLSQACPPRWSPTVETVTNWYRHNSKHPRLTRTVTHAMTAPQRDATPTIFSTTALSWNVGTQKGAGTARSIAASQFSPSVWAFPRERGEERMSETKGAGRGRFRGEPDVVLRRGCGGVGKWRLSLAWI